MSRHDFSPSDCVSVSVDSASAISISAETMMHCVRFSEWLAFAFLNNEGGYYTWAVHRLCQHWYPNNTFSAWSKYNKVAARLRDNTNPSTVERWCRGDTGCKQARNMDRLIMSAYCEISDHPIASMLDDLTRQIGGKDFRAEFEEWLQ